MKRNNRDDFSAKVKNTLAKRVGYRCSNPNCKTTTIGPGYYDDQIVSIGVAAHIAAAAEGGPRYDKTMTKEERESASNGIWLCQNCSKMIDSDAEKYSVELLKKWKEAAEQGQKIKLSAESEPKEKMVYRFEIGCKNLFEKCEFAEIKDEIIIILSYYFRLKRVSKENGKIVVESGFETLVEKECCLDKLFQICIKRGLLDVEISEKKTNER